MARSELTPSQAITTGARSSAPSRSVRTPTTRPAPSRTSPVATVEVMSRAPAPVALPASQASKWHRSVVMPLYGAAPHPSERKSTDRDCESVIITVDRRTTQRSTGTSSHHPGTMSSRTRPYTTPP